MSNTLKNIFEISYIILLYCYVGRLIISPFVGGELSYRLRLVTELCSIWVDWHSSSFSRCPADKIPRKDHWLHRCCDMNISALN